LLDEFRSPKNPMPVRITGQHYDEVSVGRRFRIHEERAHPPKPDGMSQEE